MTQPNRFRSVEEALRVLEPVPPPDPARRDEARASMLALVDTQRQKRDVSDAVASSSGSGEPDSVRPWWARPFAMPVIIGNRRPAWLTAVGAALLAVAVVTGGAAYADAAIPGDAFYGVDRFIEHARLRLAYTDSGRAGLQTAFAEERLDELERIERGSLADVDGSVILSGLDESTVALQSLLDQGKFSAESEAEIQALRDALLARRGAIAGMDDVDAPADVDDEIEGDSEDGVPYVDKGAAAPDVDDLSDADGDDAGFGEDLWADEDAVDDVDGDHTSADGDEDHPLVEEEDDDAQTSAGDQTDSPDDDGTDTDGDASDDDDDTSASGNDTVDDDDAVDPGDGDDDAADAESDPSGDTSSDDNVGSPDDDASSGEGEDDAEDAEDDAVDGTSRDDDASSDDDTGSSDGSDDSVTSDSDDAASDHLDSGASSDEDSDRADRPIGDSEDRTDND